MVCGTDGVKAACAAVHAFFVEPDRLHTASLFELSLKGLQARLARMKKASGSSAGSGGNTFVTQN